MASLTGADLTAAKLTVGRLRPALLALAAGAAAALAHPPFGLLPGLLAYAVLMWLVDHADESRPLRSAFWRGWLCGLAYFGIGIWWVAEAFMVDAKNQGWMAPIAVPLLAGGLALFWGFGALLYRRFAPPGPMRLLVFAGSLCLAEWLRGHLGFPWNLPGETWRAGSAPSQFASVVGVYGLTWVTLVIVAAPALLFDKPRRRAGLITLGVAAAALALIYAGGMVRTAGVPRLATKGPAIRIVQADIEQSAKYDEAYFRDIVGRYVAMTAQPAARRPDIVIWPEGAIPISVNEYLAEGTWTRAAIVGALQPGQNLILGGYHVDGPIAAPIYKNSLFVLHRGDADVALTGLYDKYKLVPFGEYLPLEKLIEPLGIKQLVHVGDGFTAGPPPRTLNAAGVPSLQPLICYESLFPGFTWRAKSGEPAWIVNISNDAWFGKTSGPWQHLNLASYRAIEEGLPMVRATPTGVSAIIDAYGRVVPGAQLKLGQKGVIDAILPASLPKTPYARFGDLAFWLLIAVSTSFTVRHFVRTMKTA